MMAGPSLGPSCIQLRYNQLVHWNGHFIKLPSKHSYLVMGIPEMTYAWMDVAVSSDI